MAALQLVGILIILFCACYFVAAMGNHDHARRGLPTSNLGCAVILFVIVLLLFAFKGLS